MTVHLALFGNLQGVPDASLLHTSHSYGLLALSLLTAFASSYAAFAMAHINRQTAMFSHKAMSLLCFSLILGIGIWAMHFIGMLSMQLPIEVNYNLALTALSALPSILCAFLALWMMQAGAPDSIRIFMSGAVVGLGTAAMHYSGLWAMDMKAQMHLSGQMVLLSAVLGIVFAVLAFHAQARILQLHGASASPWYAWLPASLMTAAIASMHYVSLHSMYLVADPNAATTSPPDHAVLNLLPDTRLALLIAVMTGAALLILGLANALMRYRDLWLVVQARDARLRAMIDIAPDGVVTIDAQGLIQDFNPRAQKIFGHSAEDVIGRNISFLMPSPLAEQHDSHLHKHLVKPDKPISVNGREVLGKHKDGRLIPLQLAIGKANTPSGTVFVGYLQDISERKRMDAQLRIAASVFEHVREGVAIVDANHNISDVNPAFLRLMEKTREACIGQPLESLFDDADRTPDMSRLWQTVATQHYWQGESVFTRSNGSTWRQRLSVSPVLSELKRPHHFIAVISDISMRSDIHATHTSAELLDSATGLAIHKFLMERLSMSLLDAHNKSLHVGLMLVQVTPALSKPSSIIAPANLSAALRMTAQILQQQLRSSDTVALYADKQLAVLLPAVKDQSALQALFERLQKALAQSSADYAKFGIGHVQIGTASTLQSGFTTNELIKQAQQSKVMLNTAAAVIK